MSDKVKRAWKFISEDIWDIELTSLTRLKRLWIQSLRVLHLVFKGFKEDECPLHASALTFNSLMAIVPILALSLSLARVFGGADVAEKHLRGVVKEITDQLEAPAVVSTNGVDSASTVPADSKDDAVKTDDGVWTPQEIANELNKAVDAGLTQVEKINFAALGSVGLVLLLWMVVVVLGKVEGSFNTVWGVKQGRPLFRKITDYLFMVIILPFLITMAASFSIAELTAKFLQDPWASMINDFSESGFFKGFTVITLTSLTLAVLIKFMPNTNVAFKPAFIGGLVAALLFVLWLLFCAKLQVGVAKYSKLYGSFAIVPIILFWVFVSWEIVLFGAEVAFAVQNCTTYRMEYGAKRANVQSRIMLGLSVVVEAGRAMLDKKGCFDSAEYARENRISVRFLNSMLEELADLGFIAALSDKEGCYVLLSPPADITVKSVVDSIMESGVVPESLGLTNVDPRIEQIVKTAATGIGGSSSNMSVADMVNA